ncbi:hypothetical protein M8C21_033192, partial [Ambrosia artemisiifolia]
MTWVMASVVVVTDGGAGFLTSKSPKLVISEALTKHPGFRLCGVRKWDDVMTGANFDTDQSSPYANFFSPSRLLKKYTINKPTVNVYCKVNTDYTLKIRDGKVLLALSDPSDPIWFLPNSQRLGGQWSCRQLWRVAGADSLQSNEIL